METAARTLPLARIVSGGQTGADRAALDWAIAHSLPHGGWCPRGRRAEDGPLPARYRLWETPSASYPERTRWNARDSDATAVFTMTANGLNGGTLKTAEIADRFGKPVLHLWPAGQDDQGDESGNNPAERLRRFVEARKIATLNVAGPRASQQPAVYAFVWETLEAALTSLVVTASGSE